MIRHAEAEGNLYRRMHGQYDSLLTPRGYRQLEDLARRFQSVHIDAVYSSDLYRTRATARAIYEQKGLPLIPEPRLRELNFGIWEDMPFGEVLRSEGERWKLFERDPWRWSVEGAETTETVRERVTEAILDIAAKHDGGSVAAFTHGCAIRAFLCGVFGVTSPDELDRIPYVWNTAVTRLVCRGGAIEVDYAGDASHMSFGLELSGIEKANRIPDEIKRTNLRYIRESDGGSVRYRALLEDIPAGVLELDAGRGAERGEGWITVFELKENLRGLGLGVQLLGQAVSHYRALGRKKLCVEPSGGDVSGFFVYQGFGRAGESAAAAVLEKNIVVR
jgi:probable phosphoglycerate mutase